MGMSGFLNRDSAFFLGVVEFSNVPLCVVMVLKTVPAWQAKFSSLDYFSKVMFASSFVLIRLVLWPYLAAPILYDLACDMLKGRAHSNFCCSVFIVLTVLLTILQVLELWRAVFLHLFDYVMFGSSYVRCDIALFIYEYHAMFTQLSNFMSTLTFHDLSHVTIILISTLPFDLDLHLKFVWGKKVILMAMAHGKRKEP